MRCQCALNAPKRGDVVLIPLDGSGELNFAAKGYEIPERKQPDAPDAVIEEVWAIPD